MSDDKLMTFQGYSCTGLTNAVFSLYINTLVVLKMIRVVIFLPVNNKLCS